MPTLLESQRALAAFVLAAPAAGDDAYRAIYRNNTLATLGNALGLNFPAVRRVVGGDFFDAAARRFVRAAPPRAAYLDEYGAEFPAYLRDFAPAARLPYLPELAQLEWAVSRALHAPDVPGLDGARLAALAQAAADPERAAQLCFVAHPSVSTLALRHPVDAIWQAVLAQDAAAMARIDLDSGAVRLLIERDGAGHVRVRRLPRRAWRLTERLCAGATLQSALEALEAEAGAEDRDEPGSLDSVLGEHLAAGRFIDFNGSSP